MTIEEAKKIRTRIEKGIRTGPGSWCNAMDAARLEVRGDFGGLYRQKEMNFFDGCPAEFLREHLDATKSSYDPAWGVALEAARTLLEAEATR